MFEAQDALLLQFYADHQRTKDKKTGARDYDFIDLIDFVHLTAAAAALPSPRDSKFSPSLRSSCTTSRQRVLLNLAKLPCNHHCRLLMLRVVYSTVQWHAGR